MKPISVIYSIKNKYNELSKKEKQIADYIIKYPNESVNPSIDVLAKKVGTSEATLVRFVRKLGYGGYQKFRIALAQESVAVNSQVFEIDLDKQGDIPSLIFKHTIQVLETSAQTLNQDDLMKIANNMATSKNVYLFGLGGSNIAAREAFHKFIRTGISCQFAEDFHMQLMLASQATNKDCAILFSHLGNNYDIISIAESLIEKGCKTCVITSYSNSPLARMADIVLQACPLNSEVVAEAFSASIATATFINILYVELMNLKEKSGLDSLNAMREIIAKRRS
ncbi:MAG: MurR/RpiR family transcriptional regulator [Pleomorphochaeta sp.]